MPMIDKRLGKRPEPEFTGSIPGLRIGISIPHVNLGMDGVVREVSAGAPERVTFFGY